MGRAVCQALAEAGATVIVADINANGATETVQMLKGKPVDSQAPRISLCPF